MWWVPSLPPSLDPHPPVYTVRGSPTIMGRIQLCSASCHSFLFAWLLYLLRTCCRPGTFAQRVLCGGALGLGWARPLEEGVLVFLCLMPRVAT